MGTFQHTFDDVCVYVDVRSTPVSDGFNNNCDHKYAGFVIAGAVCVCNDKDRLHSNAQRAERGDGDGD